MSAKKIIQHILDENPSSAKDVLINDLYQRAGQSLRDDVQFSVARNFRKENAASDEVILGEAEKSPEQKAFKALFDKILKKYGADSPNDLEDSKKDDFFDEVGKAWKKDPANDDEGVGEETECLPCQKKRKELEEE